MASGEPQWWYELVARKAGLDQTPENQERFRRWNEAIDRLPVWKVGDVLTVAIDWDPALWSGLGRCPKISRGEVCLVVEARNVGYGGTYDPPGQELTILKSTGIHVVRIQQAGGILGHAPYFQRINLDED